MLNKKIQLIGLPRSGSSYFADAINNMIVAITLKSYTVLWEPIHVGTTKEINYYYEAIKDKDVFVIKHHAREFNRLVNHYRYNRLANSFYNIGLVRNNIFSLALSLSIANQTTEFRGKCTYTVNDKITIDRRDFRRCLKHQVKGWEAFAINRDHYNEIVYYRDLTFDPATDFNKLDFAVIKFPEVKLEDTEKDYHAPNKFEVVTNHEELHQVTLDFLKYYTHPLIEVTGVNFELRQSNNPATANRISQSIDNYRSD